MEQSPSWEANWFCSQSRNSPHFTEPEVSLPHLLVPAICPYPEPNQSIPCPHITLPEEPKILSSHLRLELLSCLFPSGFTTKTLYTSLLFPLRATGTAYLFLLDVFTWRILGEEYRPLSSSLCSFIHSLVTSSLLGSNILLSTLLSHFLSLHYFLNVSDQVSYWYKTTRKITVLYIFIFIYLDSKRFCTEW
jgi:hypothetical protein